MVRFAAKCLGTSERTRRVRHFWLCDACAHAYTLYEVEGVGVLLRQSAKEMKLKAGDTVRCVIKSTEVMLEKS